MHKAVDDSHCCCVFLQYQRLIGRLVDLFPVSGAAALDISLSFADSLYHTVRLPARLAPGRVQL